MEAQQKLAGVVRPVRALTGGDSDDELTEEELHVAESVVPRELKAIGGTIGSERSLLYMWLKLHLLVMFVYFAFFGQELGDVPLFGRAPPWTPHGYAPNSLGQMKYACESVAFLSMFLPLQALRHCCCCCWTTLADRRGGAYR